MHPNDADVLNNYGVVLLETRRYEAARDVLLRATKSNPGDINSYINLGSAHRFLSEPEQSLAAYDLALSIDQCSAVAHCGRGLALRELGRFDEAIDAYKTSLAISPEHAESHLNMGITYLLRGDYLRGWPGYEWRWKSASAAMVQVRAEPPWNGESLRGKRILLWSEQGFGDTIQFCRFANTLAGMGATVILEVPAVLRELMMTLESNPEVIVTGQTHLSCDFHCALMSVPYHLQTTLESIPNRVPYLFADKSRFEYWNERTHSSRPTIGITCSGNSEFKRDRDRPVPLQHFVDVLGEDYELVLLQPECREHDAAYLSRSTKVHELRTEIQSFADTAAALQCLDFVVTIDTATAHLVGAMGRPAWILLPPAPDWRWGAEHERSTWYPSVRLVRKQRHEAFTGLLSRLTGW